MTSLELIKIVRDAFADDIAVDPAMILRGGDRLDDQRNVTPYDPAIDDPSDTYMESFHWSVAHLDAASWRHYLPQLADYVVRNFDKATLVGEATIFSLCAPDQDPPRLATLTSRQQYAVTKFLEFLAFADGSAYQEGACRATDEWWSPGALYRPRASTTSTELR